MKQPVMDGNVALLPRTFRWRLDFSSPPSTTSHLTVSSVFDFTDNDIIPPMNNTHTTCEARESLLYQCNYVSEILFPIFLSVKSDADAFRIKQSGKKK